MTIVKDYPKSVVELDLFADNANALLAGKFISQTVFEKDKKEIKKISYLSENVFAMQVQPQEPSQSVEVFHFSFQELFELLKVGALTGEEGNMVDNCYFIVK